MLLSDEKAIDETLLMIGTRIQQQREQIGFTREKLAEASGLSVQSIVKVESGTRNFRILSLISIARALGLSTDYLLGLAEYDDMQNIQLLLSMLDDDGKSIHQRCCSPVYKVYSKIAIAFYPVVYITQEEGVFGHHQKIFSKRGCSTMLIYLQMIESDREKDKFEQLYLKYRNLMYHSAFTILHNREDSEDSVHQAFVSIIENLDKIGDTNSAETRSFCVLCCRNKALDLYRRKNRWGEIELFENLQELPTPEPESQLDAAVAGLPLALGTVILLHYDNGYSIEEIAEILNISVSAARKRLTRAKAMLRKILREEGMMK